MFFRLLRRIPGLKLDLEKQLEAIKLRWKANEELQQALDDAHNLMEISLQKWQTQYGKALEKQGQIIYDHTFSSPVSSMKDSGSLETKQDYFAYRMALTELTLTDNSGPLYFFVAEMKEPEAFWEEVLAYLQELSLSRQLIFDTTDERLRQLAENTNLSLMS